MGLKDENDFKSQAKEIKDKIDEITERFHMRYKLASSSFWTKLINRLLRWIARMRPT